MIEMLIEIVAGGLFELFAELFAGLARFRDGDEPAEPHTKHTESSTEVSSWSPAVQQSSKAVTAKLLLGAAAGAGWGYYVGSSTDVAWPQTFWSFAIIGVIAFVCRIAGVSNEQFASRFKNRFLRGLVTFTPQRFSNWAMLSLITAIAVAGGFLLGK